MRFLTFATIAGLTLTIFGWVMGYAVDAAKNLPAANCQVVVKHNQTNPTHFYPSLKLQFDIPSNNYTTPQSEKPTMSAGVTDAIISIIPKEVVLKMLKDNGFAGFISILKWLSLLGFIICAVRWAIKDWKDQKL